MNAALGFKRLCVFCGSNRGVRPEYGVAARKLGVILAERGVAIVYGGGCVGLMGELANAALAAGGNVIGVIPKALAAKEIAHENLTELRVVGSMHERKATMAELADGFIALPGGFGTFEEFCEVVTWTQLGLHTKPCGLLNVAGYYDPLIRLFEHGITEGFIRTENAQLVIAEADIETLLSRMAGFRAPEVPKWIDWESS